MSNPITFNPQPVVGRRNSKLLCLPKLGTQEFTSMEDFKAWALTQLEANPMWKGIAALDVEMKKVRLVPREGNAIMARFSIEVVKMTSDIEAPKTTSKKGEVKRDPEKKMRCAKCAFWVNCVDEEGNVLTQRRLVPMMPRRHIMEDHKSS